MVHFVSAMGRLLKAGRDCTEVSQAASILVYGTPRKEKGESLSRNGGRAFRAFCRPLEQVQMLSPVSRIAQCRHGQLAQRLRGNPSHQRYDDQRQRKNQREPKPETVWLPRHLFPLVATPNH